MIQSALNMAILNDGITLTYFFNGRLLTSEDLTRDQTANRAAFERLGQALGEGVAFGLEVRQGGGGPPPKLVVQPGLALNRHGQQLWLADQLTLCLHQPEQNGASEDRQAEFGACDPAAPGSPVATGLYVLTLGPAEQLLGRTRVSGLGNTSAACNFNTQVNGVQFSLRELKLSGGVLEPPQKARSQVAYALFLAAKARRQTMDPLENLDEANVLKSVVPDLTAYELPLAVLRIGAEGQVTMLDEWAVRRGLAPGLAVPGAHPFWSKTDAVQTRPGWLDWTGARSLVESEGIFYQFQAHFAALANGDSGFASQRAQDVFAFLPPVGFLPAGFNWRVFLGPHAPKEVEAIDSGLARSLVWEALTMDPAEIVAEIDAPQSEDPVIAYEVYKPSPDAAYLLFARSRQGRAVIALPEAVVADHTFDLTARTTDSNLVWNGLPVGTRAMTFWFNQLPAGQYQALARLQGAQSFTFQQNFDVVAGQVTFARIEIDPSDLPQPPGRPDRPDFVVPEIVLSNGDTVANVRMSLVSGTFGDPTSNAVLKQARPVDLGDEALERIRGLREWLDSLFPNEELTEKEPVVLLAADYRPLRIVMTAAGKESPYTIFNVIRQVPAEPQAWLAFGSRVLPLTVVPGAEAEPAGLDALDTPGLDDLLIEFQEGNFKLGTFGSRGGKLLREKFTAGEAVRWKEIQPVLERFGVTNLDQLAGAWSSMMEKPLPGLTSDAQKFVIAAAAVERRRLG